MGRGYSENLEVFRDIKQIRAEEYVSMDRPEFVKLDVPMNNILGAENSSYTNTFKVELEADRLLLFH